MYNRISQVVFSYDLPVGASIIMFTESKYRGFAYRFLAVFFTHIIAMIPIYI